MHRRYFFIIPFFVSLLAFVVLNVTAYAVVSDVGTPGFESTAEGGFPFYWYTRNWIQDDPVDQGVLVANIAVASIVSYVGGWTFRRVFAQS
jgi:hypothetical protein